MKTTKKYDLINNIIKNKNVQKMNNLRTNDLIYYYAYNDILNNIDKDETINKLMKAYNVSKFVISLYYNYASIDVMNLNEI